MGLFGRNKNDVPEVPKRDSWLLLTNSSIYFVWHHNNMWIARKQSTGEEFGIIGFIHENERNKIKHAHIQSDIVHAENRLLEPSVLREEHVLSHFVEHHIMLRLDLKEYTAILERYHNDPKEAFPVALSELQKHPKKGLTSLIVRVYREIA